MLLLFAGILARQLLLPSAWAPSGHLHLFGGVA